MLLVSIIVPVYKAEQYIRTCVDSVLAQTFQDWELILVNDGSPDNSGDICDSYTQLDSRIKVIHKSNGGVSSARNLGISSALGEWLYFIDSDDFIENQTLKTSLQESENNGIDLIVHGLVDDYLYNNTTRSVDYNMLKNNDYQSVIEYTDKCGLLRGPVCKLFKKSIVNMYNIRFDESICYGEDTKFTFEYLRRCKSITFVSKHFYHYCFRNEESLTKRDYDYTFWDRTAKMLLNLRIPIMDLFKMPDSYYQYIRFEYISHLSRAIYSMYKSDMGYTERIRYIKCLQADLHLKKGHRDLSYLNRMIYLIKFPTFMDIVVLLSLRLKKKIF